MIKNISIFCMVLVTIGSLYYSRIKVKDSVRMSNAIEALKDTLHTYKTANGAIGGYISTIQGDKNSLMSLLELSSGVNKDYAEIIDSLKKIKNLQTATIVHSETHTIYKDIDADTIFKGLSFTRNIKDEWVDEIIKVDSNKLSRDLKYYDGYTFTNSLKKNKGLFKGSTLTTFVSPKNPNTKVTGLTSVSTQIDKRKLRLGFFVGPSLSINKQYNLSPTISVGLGLTF